MRLPSYLKTEKMEVIGNTISLTVSFTRFPYELMFGKLKYKMWLYPKFIINFYKTKRELT